MSTRWQVSRGLVYYRKKAYYVGDFMPVEFTARDQARNVYSRRLVEVEIPDESVIEKIPEIEVPEVEIPEVPKIEIPEEVIPEAIVSEVEIPEASVPEVLEIAEVLLPSVITPTGTEVKEVPKVLPKPIVKPIVKPLPIIKK